MATRRIVTIPNRVNLGSGEVTAAETAMTIATCSMAGNVIRRGLWRSNDMPLVRLETAYQNQN